MPFHRQKIAFFFALALSLFLQTGRVLASQIENIRIGNQTPTIIRVVVDLSQKVDFKVFSLQNPMRVVIDLPQTTTQLKESNLPKHAHINAIRFGSISPSGKRVVLEFNRNVLVQKSFILPPQSAFKWRLVIDLELLSSNASTPPPSVATQEQTRQRNYTPPALQKKRLIVLDPGHGGRDPGAIGVSGVYEKHLTLAMGKQLKRILESTGRYQVKLTRERDVAISLFARRNFARKQKADLFMSIHADSIRKQTTKGLSIYTLSEVASDKEAEKLAEKENKSDIIAGLDFSGETQEVTDILIDLARRETNNHSSYFAEKAVTEIKKVVHTLPNTHRFAGFAVLKSPDVPSVLIEMGYLSNREEERLLQQPSYREKLALAVLRAVDIYFSEKHKANFN